MVVSARNAGSAQMALRIFGAQLAVLRTQAGLTQAEHGTEIGYSESTVASVEQGRRVPQPEFIERSDAVLRANGVLKAAARYIAEARFPAHFQDIPALEAEAVSLYSYEPQLIPGLLQTEEYARAVVQAHCPPLDDETVEERVAARLGRQALLSRRPAPVLGFVVEESSLHRRVVEGCARKRQLEHLVECSRRRNVTIQVMPERSGFHPGMNGPILLLEMPDRRTLAYMVAQEVSTLVTDREEVSVYAQRHGIIRAQALGTEESARLIERMAGEL